jgi:glycosyltransferase involved in cell wall biosynthesis
MKKIGARDVRLLAAAALPDSEIALLGALGAPAGDRIRFVSIGNLIYWKTFDLGLRAFAEADIPDSEYLIVGDGPERDRLRTLSRDLGIDDRVRWLGRLPREQVLEKLEMCHALVHPSLHDSGGWVCLEAMAAGRPVICLDLAGPSFLVGPGAGIRIPTESVDSVIQDLAKAMRILARNPEVRRQMGARGKSHVRNRHSWSATGDELHSIHLELSEADPSYGTR